MDHFKEIFLQKQRTDSEKNEDENFQLLSVGSMTCKILPQKFQSFLTMKI